VKVTGWVNLSPTEAALENTLANVGPVSVAVYVSANFQSYRSGVFYDNTCPLDRVNHAVVLVGYGADSSGRQYYILRNSWGSSWGSNGYMLFARNNNNMCSIASYGIYPIVQASSGKTSTASRTLSSKSKSRKLKFILKSSII